MFLANPIRVPLVVLLELVTTSFWRNQIRRMGAGLNVTTGAGPGAGYAGADLLGSYAYDMWRACQKNGGSPTFILAGTDFIKSYEIAADC